MNELLIEKTDQINNTVAYCLGEIWLGICNDFFQKEFSVYNIGAAIGAVAIILAIISLLKPIYQIRGFLFRRRLAWIALILFLANIAFVLVAAIIPYLRLNNIPLWGYHIFWEITAAIFFILAITIFVLILTLPIKSIAINSSDRIFRLCMICIARGYQYREALAEELQYFISNLIMILQSKDKEACYFTQKTLQICADSELCQIIVRREPLTFQNIIQSFKTPGPQERNALLLQEIFYQALSSDDSILVREMKDTNRGIGSVNNFRGIITTQVFEEYGFIYRYNLLKYRDFAIRDSLLNYRLNFILFWENALESFFDNVSNLEYAESLRDGFNQIQNFIQEDNNFVQHSFYFWCFRLNTIINPEKQNQMLDYYDNKLPDIPQNYHGEYRPEFLNRYNIFDVMAEGYYKLVEACIRRTSNKNQWAKRRVVKEIYQGFDRHNEGAFFDAIKKRFEILLKRKIQENLKGYYPMMLNAFFDMYGWDIFTHPETITDFEKEIMLMVAGNIPRFTAGYIYNYPDSTKPEILEKNKIEAQKILNDMLPEGMTYDLSTNNLIYYYSGNRNGAKINLGNLLNTSNIEVEKFEI